MNYKFEIKHHRKDNAPENIKSTCQQATTNVVADENLKRRSRSGGYVAWPERERGGRTQGKRKPGAP